MHDVYVTQDTLRMETTRAKQEAETYTTIIVIKNGDTNLEEKNMVKHEEESSVPGLTCAKF